MPPNCWHCINHQRLEDQPRLSLYHQRESLSYSFQLFNVSSYDCFKTSRVLLLLLKLSLALAFKSPFFLSSSPLSWLCSWMIESAILYASCLSLVLCGGEGERGGERKGDRAEDTERELQLLMTARSGEKTRLPCSINCCLRGTDILGGQRFWKCDQPF